MLTILKQLLISFQLKGFFVFYGNFLIIRGLPIKSIYRTQAPFSPWRRKSRAPRKCCLHVAVASFVHHAARPFHSQRHFPSVADPCLLPAQPVAKSPTALSILPTSPALPRSALHDPVPISPPPRCPGRSLLCSEGACPAVLPRGVGRAGPHSADFPDAPPRRAWLSLAPLAPAGAPGVGVKAGHSWRRPREERARGEQPRTQRFALPGLEAAGPAPEAASSVSRG